VKYEYEWNWEHYTAFYTVFNVNVFRSIGQVGEMEFDEIGQRVRYCLIAAFVATQLSAILTFAHVQLWTTPIGTWRIIEGIIIQNSSRAIFTRSFFTDWEVSIVTGSLNLRCAAIVTSTGRWVV